MNHGTAWKGRFSTLALVACVLVAQGAAAGTGNDKCIDRMNNDGRKVLNAEMKSNEACVKDSVGLEITTCIEATGLKTLLAQGKTVADAVANCLFPVPTFAYGGAFNVNGAAVAAADGIVRDLFGFVVRAGTGDELKCQAKVTKSAGKLAVTKWKEFRSCKKGAIAAAANAGALTAACLGAPAGQQPDPKTKIAKAKLKLEAAAQGCVDDGFSFLSFAGSCTTEATAAAFTDCIDARVECRMCRAFKRADAISAADLDCDAFDDGVANGSCSPCGDGMVDVGEDCDAPDDAACPGQCLPPALIAGEPECICWTDPTPRFRCSPASLNAGDACFPRGFGGGCDLAVAGDDLGVCGQICSALDLNAGDPCSQPGAGGGCDLVVLGDNLGTCEANAFHADIVRPIEGGWSGINSTYAQCILPLGRSTGTLGAVVFDDSTPYVLSNSHVLGRSSDRDVTTIDGNCLSVPETNAPAGAVPLEPVMQPGTLDGGVVGADDVGNLPPIDGGAAAPALDPYEPLCMSWGRCVAGDMNAGALCTPIGPGGGCLAAVNVPGTCEAVCGAQDLNTGVACGPPGPGGGCDRFAVNDNLGSCGELCPGAAACAAGDLNAGTPCDPPGPGAGCDLAVLGDNLGFCDTFPRNLCNSDTTNCVDSAEYNCIDASIAELTTAIPAVPAILDVGPNMLFGIEEGPESCKDDDVGDVADDLIGRVVVKSGRTTGFTWGIITGFVHTSIGYGSPEETGNGTAKFANQIVIRSLGPKFCSDNGHPCLVDAHCPMPNANKCLPAFSAGGDSGSIVFLAGGGNPVGLLFGGGPVIVNTVPITDETFANPIKPVLERFGVDFQ